MYVSFLVAVNVVAPNTRCLLPVCKSYPPKCPFGTLPDEKGCPTCNCRGGKQIFSHLSNVGI